MDSNLHMWDSPTNSGDLSKFLYRTHEYDQEEKELIDSQGSLASCAIQWDKSLAFNCYDCQSDPMSVLCPTCFLGGNHEGHHVCCHTSSQGCCDCGDPSAWDPKGFCSRHQGLTEETETEKCLEVVPYKIRVRLISILDRFTELHLEFDPKNEKETIDKIVPIISWFKERATRVTAFRYVMVMYLLENNRIETLIDNHKTFPHLVKKWLYRLYLTLVSSPHFRRRLGQCFQEKYATMIKSEEFRSLGVQILIAGNVSAALIANGFLETLCTSLKMSFTHQDVQSDWDWILNVARHLSYTLEAENSHELLHYKNSSLMLPVFDLLASLHRFGERKREYREKLSNFYTEKAQHAVRLMNLNSTIMDSLSTFVHYPFRKPKTDLDSLYPHYKMFVDRIVELPSNINTTNLGSLFSPIMRSFAMFCDYLQILKLSENSSAFKTHPIVRLFSFEFLFSTLTFSTSMFLLTKSIDQKYWIRSGDAMIFMSENHKGVPETCDIALLQFSFIMMERFRSYLKEENQGNPVVESAAVPLQMSPRKSRKLPDGSSPSDGTPVVTSAEKIVSYAPIYFHSLESKTTFTSTPETSNSVDFKSIMGAPSNTKEDSFYWCVPSPLRIMVLVIWEQFREEGAPKAPWSSLRGKDSLGSMLYATDEEFLILMNEIVESVFASDESTSTIEVSDQFRLEVFWGLLGRLINEGFSMDLLQCCRKSNRENFLEKGKAILRRCLIHSLCGAPNCTLPFSKLQKAVYPNLENHPQLEEVLEEVADIQRNQLETSDSKVSFRLKSNLWNWFDSFWPFLALKQMHEAEEEGLKLKAEFLGPSRTEPQIHPDFNYIIDSFVSSLGHSFGLDICQNYFKIVSREETTRQKISHPHRFEYLTTWVAKIIDCIRESCISLNKTESSLGALSRILMELSEATKDRSSPFADRVLQSAIGRLRGPQISTENLKSEKSTTKAAKVKQKMIFSQMQNFLDNFVVSDEEIENPDCNTPKSVSDIEGRSCVICLTNRGPECPLAFITFISSYTGLQRMCSSGNSSLPFSNPVVNTCGHLAHMDCLFNFRANIMKMSSQQFFFVKGRNGEFMCPVCRSAANSMIPLYQENTFQKNWQLDEKLETKVEEKENSQYIRLPINNNFKRLKWPPLVNPNTDIKVGRGTEDLIRNVNTLALRAKWESTPINSNTPAEEITADEADEEMCNFPENTLTFAQRVGEIMNRALLGMDLAAVAEDFPIPGSDEESEGEGFIDNDNDSFEEEPTENDLNFQVFLGGGELAVEAEAGALWLDNAIDHDVTLPPLSEDSGTQEEGTEFLVKKSFLLASLLSRTTWLEPDTKNFGFKWKHLFACREVTPLFWASYNQLLLSSMTQPQTFLTQDSLYSAIVRFTSLSSPRKLWPKKIRPEENQSVLDPNYWNSINHLVASDVPILSPWAADCRAELLKGKLLEKLSQSAYRLRVEELMCLRTFQVLEECIVTLCAEHWESQMSDKQRIQSEQLKSISQNWLKADCKAGSVPLELSSASRWVGWFDNSIHSTEKHEEPINLTPSEQELQGRTEILLEKMSPVQNSPSSTPKKGLKDSPGTDLLRTAEATLDVKPVSDTKLPTPSYDILDIGMLRIVLQREHNSTISSEPVMPLQEALKPEYQGPDKWIKLQQLLLKQAKNSNENGVEYLQRFWTILLKQFPTVPKLNHLLPNLVFSDSPISIKETISHYILALCNSNRICVSTWISSRKEPPYGLEDLQKERVNEFIAGIFLPKLNKALRGFSMFAAFLGSSFWRFSDPDKNRISYCDDDTKSLSAVLEVLGIPFQTESPNRMFYLTGKFLQSPEIIEVVKLAIDARLDQSPPNLDSPLSNFTLEGKESFYEILRAGIGRNCPKCSTQPSAPALCVLCGAVVCIEGDCCSGPEGEATTHARLCGGGQSLFLAVTRGVLVAVDAPLCGVWDLPYVDSYGETDPHWKRGRMPLTLHRPSLEELRRILMTGEVARAIVRHNEKHSTFTPLSL
eukprot:GHVP01053570.1.p1 GENE.GHVP01053570.1~~GHVP01053570.1.p1  ORF type:complete len:1990 (+),score=323.49 GHVP01053570.1:85-6054(+)